LVKSANNQVAIESLIDRADAMGWANHLTSPPAALLIAVLIARKARMV
jgi:hypothetical protein